MDSTPMLEIKNLTISVQLANGERAIVVQDVSFAIPAGGTVGLVGESGSGKTMTSMAVIGLLPPAARVEAGEILFEGEDLLRKTMKQMELIRGKRIGIVMQDPMTALDPLFTIRNQLAEPLKQHRKLRGADLDAAMVTSLEGVQLSAAKERLRQYPHQLSGGMRQRVTSAIALAGQPQLLIADEPTTALDTTTQARYLHMLAEVQEETGFALLLIAHDLLVVEEACRRVVVMYAGEVVEDGVVGEVFQNPQHPYTRALLGAIPTSDKSVWLESIKGHIPDITEKIQGCRFAPRCKFARDICRERAPELTPRGDENLARCWGTEDDGWVES